MATVETLDDLTDGSPLLPAQYDRAEWAQRHEIVLLLGRLPWRQRQVMAWTFDGYPPREIAAEAALREIMPEGRHAGLGQDLAAALDVDAGLRMILPAPPSPAEHRGPAKTAAPQASGKRRPGRRGSHERQRPNRSGRG